MQKVVDFLEKYCQWLAVGIAGLFFLFALWQFLPGVSTPVTATVGNQTLPPSAVDQRILEDDAQPLTALMNSNRTIDASVPKYAPEFDKKLNSKPESLKSDALPAWAVNAQPFTMPPEIVPDESKIAPTGPERVGLVASLPALPAANLETAPTTGFAQVADVPVVPPGTDPNLIPPPVQPVAAVPGQPAGPPSKDVTWVRVSYTIPMQRIRQAFLQVGIPQAFNVTGFVRVELVRQRQLAGDEWGPEEVVNTTSLDGLRPMPPANAPVNALMDYRGWAYANQQALLQPRFFQILGGEDPNVSKPPEVIATEVFNPETFPPNGDVSKLTAEERRAVMEVRRRRYQEQRQQRQPGRGARPPAGRGGRGGMGEDAEMLPRVAPMPAATSSDGIVRLQYRPPMNPYGTVPGEEGMMDDGTGMMTPGMPQPGQPITLPPVPQAPFDPTASTVTDVFGYCYDTDARSDSTYRYRVRYMLANPLYNAQNVAQDPSMTQQFALVGEDATRWSDPIEIAPRTHIFLTQQPSLTGSTVRFNIFRWQDGRQFKSVQTFGSGDSIGRAENNVDFRTPWTLVEVRRDSATNAIYALLMNSEGRLRRRVFSADQNDPTQKRLDAQVAAATGAAAAQTGMPME